MKRGESNNICLGVKKEKDNHVDNVKKRFYFFTAESFLRYCFLQDYWFLQILEVQGLTDSKTAIVSQINVFKS